MLYRSPALQVILLMRVIIRWCITAGMFLISECHNRIAHTIRIACVPNMRCLLYIAHTILILLVPRVSYLRLSSITNLFRNTHCIDNISRSICLRTYIFVRVRLVNYERGFYHPFTTNLLCILYTPSNSKRSWSQCCLYNKGCQTNIPHCNFYRHLWDQFTRQWHSVSFCFARFLLRSSIALWFRSP